MNDHNHYAPYTGRAAPRPRPKRKAGYWGVLLIMLALTILFLAGFVLFLSAQDPCWNKQAGEKAGGGYCNENRKVVECLGDNHCPWGWMCSGSACSEIKGPCWDKKTGEQVPGGYCSREGKVAECLKDSHCSTDQVCLNNFCSEIKGPCWNRRAGERVAGGYCNAEGKIVECIGDNDCPWSWVCSDNVCSESQGLCTNKKQGEKVPGGYCSDEGKIVECLEDGHCPLNRECSGNVCSEAQGVCTGKSRGERVKGGYCSARGKVAECLEDDHCSGDRVCSDNICSKSSNLCASKREGERVAGGYCSDEGNVVECTSNDHCPSGEVCGSDSACSTRQSNQPPSGISMATPFDIPVLVLNFFPVDPNDRTRLDRSVVGTDLHDLSLTGVRARTDDLTRKTAKGLAEGSRYKGYKNSAADPSLSFRIVETREYLEPVPVKASGFSDKFRYLNRVNICDYVDRRGIKQVWVWMYHNGRLTVPVESNMAMGTNIRDYWNHHSYGDISNSGESNDLPVCKNTYTVYEYNYGRELGESIEDHTHQIEWLLNYVGSVPRRNSLPAGRWSEPLFWGRFVGSDRSHRIISPGCGWTHHPPNAERDYDWHNTRTVLSDCENWNPQRTGAKTQVSCHTWFGSGICETMYGSSYCSRIRSRAGSACGHEANQLWKIWWMQNIPGKDSGLTYEGKSLRNWWEFYGDFDRAIVKGRSLTE